MHTQKISEHSAIIAKKNEVRNILKSFQKKFAKKYLKCCIEGRDISTKILPNSDIKFYFKCNLNTSAVRRFRELKKIISKLNLQMLKNPKNKK